MKEKVRLVIEVDDREPKEIDEVLVRHNFEPFRHRMKEGDYVYKWVIVERKTINDFCGSIMDGRLKRQVSNMVGLERFKKRIIVVVGNWDTKISNIHNHCVLGMLSSLVLKDVSVLWVKDEEDFCFLLKRLCERVDEKDMIDVVG